MSDIDPDLIPVLRFGKGVYFPAKLPLFWVFHSRQPTRSPLADGLQATKVRV